MKLDFERLFASAPSPFVLLDREWRIVWANDAYLQVTGRDRDAIVGRVLTEAFPSPPDSVSDRMLRGSLERVFRTGQPDHLPLIPYPIATRDGQVEERYWSATHTPIAGADGTATFLMQNTQDVTEIYRSESGGLVRRAQEAGIARRAEEVTNRFMEIENFSSLLRTAFSQAPGFMAVLTGPQHILEMGNDACFSLVGHDRNVLGRPLSEAMPELADQGIIGLLDEVMRTGETQFRRSMRLELWNTEAGEFVEYFLDFVHQPLLGPDGSPIGIFVQGQDMTAQVHAEAASRDAEARFRSLAQTSPSQAWTALPDGSFDWVSDRLLSFTGQTSEAMLAGGWAQAVNAEDRNRAMADWANAVAEGSFYETELRIRRADGAYLWHLVRAAPVRDESGVIVRWVGTNTDIDAQKANAAELANLNATLEDRVAERNRELEEMGAALRHSQKLEAIGNLAGGVAHDFNNLLQAISGSLALATRELPAGSGARHRLLAAMKSVERGAALSAQLLAFSRRQALDPRAVDLSELLEDMSYLLHSAVGEEIVLDVAADPDVWPAFADAANIENAVLNLVVNARDAMGGRGTLRITVRNCVLSDPVDGVPPGDYVEIVVIDDGPGMTKDVADRAFEPFFTTKPAGEGTGLGLPSVYGFARQSGGLARLDTAPGEGTSVVLTLPRSEAPAERRSSLADDEAIQGEGRILLVEDDDDVRDATAALLSDLGYVVVSAPHADAAVEVLNRDSAFDLLLTDVVMPGRTTAVELSERAQRVRPGLPVLFTSGYSRQAIERDGRIAAGRHFLSKPYTQISLARKLRELMAPHADDGHGGPGPGRGQNAGQGMDGAQDGARYDRPRPDQNRSGGPSPDDTSSVRATPGGAKFDGAKLDGAKLDGAKLDGTGSSATGQDGSGADGAGSGGVGSDGAGRDGAGQNDGGPAAGFQHGRRSDGDGSTAREPGGASQDAGLPTGRNAKEIGRDRGAGAPGAARNGKAGADGSPPPDGGHAQAAAARGGVAGTGLPLRVLLCEDEPLIRMDLRDMLAHMGAEVADAGTGTDALAHLRKSAFDVLITDLGLPDMHGKELAHQARKLKPDLGLIFATGHDDGTLATEFPDSRLLTKPFRPEHLAQALQRVRLDTGSGPQSTVARQHAPRA